MQGFIPDICRILGKYSLLESLNRFETGVTFMSKLFWKRVVRADMELRREREWRIKIENSASVNWVTHITQINKVYVLWEACREFPNYYHFTPKAIRMLGLMFSGKWVRMCHFVKKLYVFYLQLTTCYCFAEKKNKKKKKTNEFREILEINSKFRLKFFSDFISEPPNSQLKM